MKTRKKIEEKALAQLMLDVKFGFDNEDEIFDNISFTFYRDKGYNEDLVEIELMKLISKYYNRHQSDSSNWQFPTDFDKLAIAFDELTKQKIICLHNVYNRQDGKEDCLYTANVLAKRKIEVIGFCYYNSHDLELAINSGEKKLFLEFESLRPEIKKVDEIKNLIIKSLEKNNLQVNIPDPASRIIEIKNIDWKKKPDQQDWWVDRVINLMTNT